MNQMNEMIAWENGELSHERTVRLFQSLINSGMAWTLQGCYGRTASELIQLGYCKLGTKSRRNAYGGTVPSRYQVTT